MNQNRPGPKLETVETLLAKVAQVDEDLKRELKRPEPSRERVERLNEKRETLNMRIATLCDETPYGRFIVYHLEETGDPENGPGGLAECFDERFQTREEAEAWIKGQAKPDWYKIQEIDLEEAAREKEMDNYFVALSDSEE